ncbi:unnamed protein product, partial [Nesidiocoris tenuis]
PAPPMAARSLIMVAKCLQNLANLVEFGGKEPYMEVVNPFILKNKERMVVYLDQLSNVPEKPESEGERVKGDPARDLGTLHHICVAHLKELQALSRTQSLLSLHSFYSVPVAGHPEEARHRHGNVEQTQAEVSGDDPVVRVAVRRQLRVKWKHCHVAGLG